MIAVVLLVLFGSALAQYPHQNAPHYQPQSYPQQYYQPQPQQPAYQPQPQQPAYQPQPQQYVPPQQQQRSYNPAAVHYVNIGTQLQGDYKFGYDTGKGNDGQSFREETRLPDGSVQGSYGYIDETGKQRIVRYTAGKDGYKAEGDGISPPQAAQPAAPAYNNNNNYVNGNNYQQQY